MIDWNNWSNQNGIDHWKSLVKHLETFKTLYDCSDYKINFSSNMWSELEKCESQCINDERYKKLNDILNEKN